MDAPPVITLTTDFGLADPYVAAIKGVILSLNPRALIVDISHAIRPQHIQQGAFLLAAAAPYFARGSIHLAVVDPGVGTPRRAFAIQTPNALFVGPDNGLLSAALPNDVRAEARPAGQRGASPLASPVPLPSGYRAVSLENHRYFRHPVSPTFHGRDIFAPVAAHLSLGLALDDLGPPLDSVLALPPFRAARQPDGSLCGRVLHIDSFGNLITDIRDQDIAQGKLLVEVAAQRIEGPQRTYGESQGLVAVIGSLGYLEIACVGGSAASALGADIGLPVTVRPAP